MHFRSALTPSKSGSDLKLKIELQVKDVTSVKIYFMLGAHTSKYTRYCVTFATLTQNML